MSPVETAVEVSRLSRGLQGRNDIRGVLHKEEDISLREMWHVLVTHKRAIFACIGIAVLIAIAAALILPTRYEAVVRLTLNSDSQNALGIDDLQSMAMPGGADSLTKVETQVHILQTDALAWDVIKKLRLDQNPEFAPNSCRSGPTDRVETVSPNCRSKLLKQFHKRLTVESVPKTEMFELRFRNHDPTLAMTIANTLADTYLERNFENRFEATAQASNWLAKQLDDVRKNVEATQQKYTDVQKKSGIIGAIGTDDNNDDNNNILLSKLDETSKQLVQAQSDRIVREARYRVAMSGNPELIADVVPGSTLQVLRAQQVDLKNQYAQLSSRYGEAFPRVAQVKTQLAQVDTALQAEIKKTGTRMQTEYNAALRSENMLRAELEKQKQEAFKMNEDAIQLGILKRELDAGRDLYESMTKKLKEAGIVAGLKSTTVTVVDPAGIPTEKAEPRSMLIIALGALTGLFGGICAAFALENTNDTIRTPEDVEALCSLPSLGAIPAMTLRNSRNGDQPGPNGEVDTLLPVTMASPNSQMAEAYRSLRTTLLLAAAGAPPKIIVVTSALPSEGKTTTSINCAVVLAQKNRRVLLIDADLRRSNIHATMGVPNNAGLSGVLAGCDPNNCYSPHPLLPNLTVLPGGHRPPMPAELLDSDRMRELIKMWRSQFDHVIIDTPPILGMSDAVILSTMADSVLVVVRASQSGRQAVRHAREVLRGVNAKVTGAILNAVSVNSMEYYGYYGKDYHHYYGADEEKN